MAEPTRRDALAAGGALAAGAMLPGACTAKPRWPGTLAGPDRTAGHALRDGKFAATTGPEERVGIAIAGGGVAGLSAAWRLVEAGFTDFRLFELESEPGGNARSGRNDVSAYPLGAHYLPVPNREAGALRHMLTRFGMVVGTDAQGGPRYDPYQLCADLEERLFWRGAWQEGLYPRRGLSAEDRSQSDRFEAEMAAFRSAVGSDGRPAFASPMALSSSDPQFAALDRMDFASWLTRRGFSSKVLRDHLRYCCRDDYGCEPEHVSAWAGIHYFAARRGWAADGAGDRELTWPEGNGRLVALMREAVGPRISSRHIVTRADGDGADARLTVAAIGAGSARTVRAGAAILATPHFVTRRIAPDAFGGGGFGYAPWVVANVTVDRLPAGPGVPVAWDNVSAGSDSLGYVVATHQSASTRGGPSVLTWYLPLSRRKPAEARRDMLTRSLADWQAMVASDLLMMNPDLEGAIRRIDLWLWAHAMARPEPGFLSHPARVAAQRLEGPLLAAHSDLSGLSLFEEAHYRGVAAAEAAMRHLGHAFESLLS